MGHDIIAMNLLLCILCREFAISGLRMAVAVKGQVVEADTGGKVKTFVQLNAIGWLIGARMFLQDSQFSTDELQWVMGVRMIGMALFALSAVLTITSGISYFRKHGRVLAELPARWQTGEERTTRWMMVTAPADRIGSAVRAALRSMQ